MRAVRMVPLQVLSDHLTRTPADMRQSAAEPLTTTAASPRPVSQISPHVRSEELSDWIERRIPFLRQRWLRELVSRYDGEPAGVNVLLDDFIDTVLAVLPGMLGPHREQIETSWLRCSELFGAVAARRGLAAGEVIDEFQLLREAVIRLLYQDPPLGGQVLSLRDVLRLNRAIDVGVTHASVGHTDALFFALFQGSGITDAPRVSEFMTEVRDELDSLRGEVRTILGRLPGRPGPQEVREEG